VIANIKDGVQWPQSSFPILTSPPSDLRGLRLGTSPSGEELVAIFVRLPDNDVPRGYVLGHIVYAIVTEAELEAYVEEHGVEMRIQD
jgi:hypothetical protein